MEVASDVGGVQGKRRPHLGPTAVKVAVGLQHTNDSVLLTVQAKILADEVRVAAKTAFPKPITQNYGMISSRLVLRRQERPAPCRLHPEQVEKIGRDFGSVDLFGLGLVSKVIALSSDR